MTWKIHFVEHTNKDCRGASGMTHLVIETPILMVLFIISPPNLFSPCSYCFSSYLIQHWFLECQFTFPCLSDSYTYQQGWSSR